MFDAEKWASIDNRHRPSKASKRWATKFFPPSFSVKLNSASIIFDKKVTKTRQVKGINDCNEIPEEKAAKAILVSERGWRAYIIWTCRPDSTYEFSACSQTNNADKAAAKGLNKFMSTAKSTATEDLNFVMFESSSFQIVVFADNWFVCDADLSPQ